MTMKRQDHEPPLATAARGWRYHHLGIPVDTPTPNERYLPQLKMYVSGFETSPFGIEWMRFESDNPVDALIRRVPHLAFEVDDLEAALAKHAFRLLAPPGSPSDGTRVAMIEHNGAPVERLNLRKNAPLHHTRNDRMAAGWLALHTGHWMNAPHTGPIT